MRRTHPARTCQVSDQNGPGTTQYISLAGACTNELPQYVAQFNGATSLVTVSMSSLPRANTSRTISTWFKLRADNGQNAYGVAGYSGYAKSRHFYYTVRLRQLYPRARFNPQQPLLIQYRGRHQKNHMDGAGFAHHIRRQYVSSYLTQVSNILEHFLGTTQSILFALFKGETGPEGRSVPGTIFKCPLYQHLSWFPNVVHALSEEIGSSRLNLQNIVTSSTSAENCQ